MNNFLQAQCYISANNMNGILTNYKNYNVQESEHGFRHISDILNAKVQTLNNRGQGISTLTQKRASKYKLNRLLSMMKQKNYFNSWSVK